MGKESETMPGNKCLYTSFQFFNFSCMLGALGILGLAIYLFIMTADSTSAFNWSFLGAAVFLSILTVFACKTRRSPGYLLFYLIFIAFEFFGMVIITIFYFVDKNDLASLASTSYAQKIGLTE